MWGVILTINLSSPDFLKNIEFVKIVICNIKSTYYETFYRITLIKVKYEERKIWLLFIRWFDS